MTGDGHAGHMTDSKALPYYEWISLAFILVLIGAIFLLDSFTPRGVPAWILYLVPLVLTHRISSLQAPLILATCCGVLTVAAYLVSPDMVELPPWIPLVNRLIGMCIFWLVAYAINQQKRITQDLIKTATLEVEHKALQLREQLLDKNAKELQDLYDHAPCGYHSLNPDGLIIAMNQTELDWLGYTAREIVGTRRFSDFLSDLDATLFEGHCSRLIQAGEISGVEFDVMRKAGATFPVLLNGTAVKDIDGRCISSRWTLVDITDRKRADNVLRQNNRLLEEEVKERTESLRVSNERLEQSLTAVRDSEDRLSSIINSAMDAIITIDEGQQITSFNSAAEAMFGCAAEEAIGKSVTQFIPQRFRAAHGSHITAFGQTSVTKRQMGALGTIFGLRTNGQEFPIEASVSQVLSRGHKFFTVILRDISHRKQVEDALKASEARFRELLECLPELIWTSNPDGAFNYLSPQWVAYTGIPSDKQLGMGWAHQVHVDDRLKLTEQWQAGIRSGQPFKLEFRLRGANRHYRWFQTHASPIRDSNRTLVRWLGTSTDIDDQKQGETLRARLGAIVESSSDAIISKSLDGSIQTWNRSAEKMFGYTATEIIGRSVTILLPPTHRHEESEIVAQIKTGKQLQPFESIRMCKGGEHLDVSLTISPIKDANGSVIGISTIARDITAKKQAEESLDQQRRLIELSHDPIFAWDVERGIVQWNKGCEQLYGYSASEALGQPSHQLLRTRFLSSLPDIMALLEVKGEWTGQIFHRTKSGQELVVDSRWSMLKTAGGTLVLESNRDITQQRQSEDIILKKNKDLETLLYVTSHDLKEPLRSIESFSVLLQERYATRLDEKGQDFLRRIVRATQRLDQLLTDILDLSRAQRMDAPIHEVEAELLVQEVLRRLEIRIKQTGATITIHSPLPRFRVNTTWAIQGIYNLVTNALKFVPAGQHPDVEISAYSEVDAQGRQHDGLVVQDRGHGIPPDQQERIFELFKRAVGREIEGTGAGLAIVKQVAERHGGRAWMTSREGGGSNFFITFGGHTASE